MIKRWNRLDDDEYSDIQGAIICGSVELVCLFLLLIICVGDNLSFTVPVWRTALQILVVSTRIPLAIVTLCCVFQTKAYGPVIVTNLLSQMICGLGLIGYTIYCSVHAELLRRDVMPDVWQRLECRIDKSTYITHAVISCLFGSTQLWFLSISYACYIFLRDRKRYKKVIQKVKQEDHCNQV